MTKNQLLDALALVPGNAEIRAYVGADEITFNAIIADPHNNLYLLDNWRTQLPTLDLTPEDNDILHIDTN